MSRISLPTTRFTVDELFRLVEADALGTARVELINGRIYRVAPRAVPHMTGVSNCVDTLKRVAGPNDWVVGQGTLILDRFTAVDPGVMWLACPKGTPAHLWPDPVLVIEISDTSYRKDSGTKLREYAFHALPEYWIANLAAGRIEVYRDPQNPSGRQSDCHYASAQHFARGQSVAVAARPEAALAVDDLLP